MTTLHSAVEAFGSYRRAHTGGRWYDATWALSLIVLVGLFLLLFQQTAYQIEFHACCPDPERDDLDSHVSGSNGRPAVYKTAALPTELTWRHATSV